MHPTAPHDPPRTSTTTSSTSPRPASTLQHIEDAVRRIRSRREELEALVLDANNSSAASSASASASSTPPVPIGRGAAPSASAAAAFLNRADREETLRRIEEAHRNARAALRQASQVVDAANARLLSMQRSFESVLRPSSSSASSSNPGSNRTSVSASTTSPDTSRFTSYFSSLERRRFVQSASASASVSAPTSAPWREPEHAEEDEGDDDDEIFLPPPTTTTFPSRRRRAFHRDRSPALPLDQSAANSSLSSLPSPPLPHRRFPDSPDLSVRDLDTPEHLRGRRWLAHIDGVGDTPLTPGWAQHAWMHRPAGLGEVQSQLSDGPDREQKDALGGAGAGIRLPPRAREREDVAFRKRWLPDPRAVQAVQRGEEGAGEGEAEGQAGEWEWRSILPMRSEIGAEGRMRGRPRRPGVGGGRGAVGR